VEWEANRRLARRRRLTVPLKRLAASAARSLLRIGRPPAPIPPESRVLVLALNRGVGDMVLLAPALQSLLDRFGGRRVTVLVRRELGEWLARLVDGRLGRHSSDSGRMLCLEESPSRRRLLSALRRERFDVAVDLVFGDWRTQVLARRSGARETVGVALEGPVLYTRAVRVSPQDHAAEMWRRLAEACGAPVRGPSAPCLHLSDAERRAAAALLAATGDPPDVLVGLHPGARGDLAALDRRWPVGRWARLAAILESDGCRCVVLGSEAEQERLAPLRRALKSAVWLVGRTSLPQAAAVIGRLDCLAGSNSGLVHLAAAMGVPTVSFGGGVHLPRWRPWGPARMHHVMMASPACGPAACWSCRWAGQACLESIGPEDVARWIMTHVQSSTSSETANCDALS